MCSLVVAVPLAILSTLIAASTNENAFDFGGTATTEAGGGVLAGALIAYLLDVLAVLLILAACSRAASAAYLGGEATAAESIRFAVSRILPLFGAYLLVVVSVLLGLLLLVVPGIFLAVRLSMTIPALVLERLGPGQAYGRSWSLVAGNWWRTFAVLLLTMLILTIFTMVIGGGIGAALGAAAPDAQGLAAVVVTAVNILVYVLLYPVVAAILTVLYYDLRVRQEGHGLEAEAREVGGGSSDPAPGGWAPPQAPGPEAPGGFGGSAPPPSGGWSGER